MISMPPQPARMILNEVALRQCPLLPIEDFIRFCDERNLVASRERLHRFEQLGLFQPLVRIQRIDGGNLVLDLNGEPVDEAFEDRSIIDTCDPNEGYEPAPIDDPDWMPFYSRFQVWELDLVLSFLSSVNWLEHFADSDATPTDWFAQRKQDFHRNAASLKRPATRRRIIAVLGQYISDAYYPRSLSDQRTIRVSYPSHHSHWMMFDSNSWDWNVHLSTWRPDRLIDLFELDRQSLPSVYRNLAATTRDCDPLWNWASLIRFVSPLKRDQLRGDALRAQTLRQLAEMIRRLHSDLYHDDLGPVDEQFGTIINHIPELDVREDTRKHLELVTNQYNINPQPRATLFVEGQTEVTFIETIYRALFGNHFGVPGIEVMNLRGVSNATGGKRRDRYSAIFRLADYLHHHQTLVYIMLDNENHAKDLRDNASTRRSIYGHRKRAIPPRRIKVWNKDFELDNFSDAELASALTSLARGKASFSRRDVRVIRESWPDKKVAGLFEEKTGRALNKPVLGAALANLVLDPRTRKRPEN